MKDRIYSTKTRVTYKDVKNSKNILWFVDTKKKEAYSCRTMPQLEQENCEGIQFRGCNRRVKGYLQ